MTSFYAHTPAIFRLQNLQRPSLMFICCYKKSLPLYDNLFAVRTVGVISRMARHIPHIGIMHPFAHGHVTGALQRGNRCGREIQQLVIGMKAGEVNRDIGTDFSQYPVYQLLQHLVRII